MAVIGVAHAEMAQAMWQGPTEVLSGDWGDTDTQFGIRYEDFGDVFPKDIIILANGDIWIPDGLVNERLKLYDGAGSLKSIIALDNATRTFPAYWFIGKLAAVNSDGTVYMSRYMGKDQYALYSPTGQLIKTQSTRPPELGVIKSVFEHSDRSGTTVIQYPDAAYNIKSPRLLEFFARDTKGGFYGVIKTGSGKQEHYRVYKYNVCSKPIASVDLLPNIIEETIEASRPTPLVDVVEEYGKPVIGPNGDIYTWKRTPDKYFIIKWTWVDDPDAPKCPKEKNTIR